MVGYYDDYVDQTFSERLIKVKLRMRSDDWDKANDLLVEAGFDFWILDEEIEDND